MRCKGVVMKYYEIERKWLRLGQRGHGGASATSIIERIHQICYDTRPQARLDIGD